MRLFQALFAAALLCVVCLLPSAAMASDVADTVFLTNGGRLRGIVIEDDPINGVTVKLPDGKTRKVPRGQVKSVAYGGDSVAARGTTGSAPSSAAGAATQVDPQNAAAADNLRSDTATSGASGMHRRPVLYGTGAAMMGLGLFAIPVGTFLIATATRVDASQCGPDGQSCPPSALNTGYDAQIAAGGGIIGLGGVLLAAGIPLFVIGLRKIPGSPSAGLRLPGWTITPFIGPTNFGLGLSGSL